MARKSRSRRAQFWAEAIVDQARRGGSARAYCRDRGLAEALFYRWRHRLQIDAHASAPPDGLAPPPVPLGRRGSAPSAGNGAASARFVAVTLTPPAGGRVSRVPAVPGVRAGIAPPAPPCGAPTAPPDAEIILCSGRIIRLLRPLPLTDLVQLALALEGNAC